MTISVWVPGTVPPGMIERAIEAAWPGAHAVTAPATPAVPARGAGDRGDAAAGPHRDPAAEDRSRRATRCGPSPPPAAASPPGSTPSSRSSPARSPAPGCAAPAAPPGSCAPAAPPASAPGCWMSSPPAATAAPPAGPPPAPTPNSPPRCGPASSSRRARSGTPRSATPPPPPPSRPARGRLRDTAAQAQARARLRGLAHGLASATALYAGRNWLARRHLRHPAAQIAARRFRRGDLLSVPELAAIARLPADASLPGLSRAGARAVAPPPVIPVPGPGVRPLGVSDTGVAPPGRHRRRRRPPSPAGHRPHRHREDHPDHRPDPRRRRRGPRGGVHRPQGRRGHRPARPPPRQTSRGRWCCSTPPTGPRRRA